ncbi:MAG: beta-lactamase family protein [Lachnospiraceae bacterium]|nr:beta-lactamase family protein [Lachnospiraceae bacterium]
MDFSEVKKLMDEAVELHGVPGSDIAIMHQGELVYRYMNGTCDDDKKVAMKGDEQYFLYSATKPITCTAALQLVEVGRLSLEDKLSDYIPEFENMMVKTSEGLKEAQKPITIQNLFSMTSGLNYDLANPSIREAREKDPNASTLDMVRAMANEPLEFEPGEHYLYGLSHDVLAAVVEVVTGMSIGDYLQENIFDRCGMTRTGFMSNKEAKDMVCSQHLYNPESGRTSLMSKENGFILTPKYESGGAGLISCVDDYMKFVAEMSDGNRLLKAETIDLMRSNQLGKQAYEEFQSCKPGYSYGLGVRTCIDGRFAHKGEFGWDGAAGAYVMIDPDNHIGVFYATHVRNHGAYLYQVLHPALRDAVYRVIGPDSKQGW